jgi:C4-type Zn-finger protein
LSRQVIKTEWAVIEVPEIEFEIKKQIGLITNIEGIFDRAINGLKETIQMIDVFVIKFYSFLNPLFDKFLFIL